MAEENNENIENTENLENTENQENLENTEGNESENNEEEKSNEFDATAFNEDSQENKNENSEEENDEENENNEENKNSDSNDDGGDFFDFSDFSDEDEENEDNIDGGSQDDNESPDNQNQKGSLTDDNFDYIKSELGLNVNNLDELKKGIQELEAENKRLSENQGNVNENEKVSALKRLKGLSDEDLLRQDLKRQNFNDEQIENAVEKLVNNELSEIEAMKIRNKIDRAIISENNKAAQSNVDSEAKLQREREDSVKSLTEDLGKLDSVFGFKMAKDKESLIKVQKGHLKYMTSGKFLGDITKDNESLIQSSWLWKNKETIFKALENGGISKGKGAILDAIENPESSDTIRFRDPEGSDEFNPSKFLEG